MEIRSVRAANVDVATLSAALDADGYAVVPGMLCAADCTALSEGFDCERSYRTTINMARHNFGRGVYRYFAYPLPDLVQQLRTSLYPPLAAVANHWQEALGKPPRYPATHEQYLAHCHAAGQTRPTPLVLRYAAGDFNCLHQDLYGEEVFPLQVAVLLSAPGNDFSGGEFVLTTQRPRMQSRVDVVSLSRGDAVIFAVSRRPAAGTRGYYQVTMRHGVSRLHSGQRFTLGIIFHDAT